MFVVGANGTGKSTLMHLYLCNNLNDVRRIAANRQVWLNSDAVDLTPSARTRTFDNIKQHDRKADSRYKDHNSSAKSQMAIFDLVDIENFENAQIANHARRGNGEEVETLVRNLSPINKLNDILQLSNLNFTIVVEKGGRLVAFREGCEPYGIAELSDGERNAVLIIASILTVPEDALILIDEPERHLHRSIVSPLLSTLLSYREDCAFVVSTHDVSLPLDQKNASTLLLRSYNHSPKYWEADYVESTEEIDSSTAIAVLGSRKKILFVEGNASSSLDLQIYQILFPEISVQPVGNCWEVEKVVKGLGSAKSFHWVEAIGIVDKDNRSDENCELLKGEGIVALDQYSVESLYYHPMVIEGVLKRVIEVSGGDLSEITKAFTEQVIEEVGKHKDRLVARLVERKVKDLVMRKTPDGKTILCGGELSITVSLDDLLTEENKIFDKFIADRDITGLVSRYPLRETSALGLIAKALEFSHPKKYEQAVRKMVSDSDEEKQNVIKIIQPVSEILDEKSKVVTAEA